VIKIFLAGEGATELGGWAREKVYRDPTPSVGVLEALLRKVSASGWTIIDACCWKNIRKYRVRPPMPAEIRNLLGVALQAKEAGAEVLAFARDRDRDEDRQSAVVEGIRSASNTLNPCPTIVGGVAIEAIEAWLLALHGERRGYHHARPKEHLAALGITHHVTVIEAADTDSPSIDSPSLQTWLDQARRALATASDD
jgi:hypothetical protein